MYVTKDQVKKYLGVNFSSGMDDFVDSIILGCQSYVEKYCGDKKFGKRLFAAPDPDTATIRRFDGSGGKELMVGDLFELESMTIDGVEFTEEEDFFLYPLNAGEEGEAYQYIQLSQPETRINSNSRVYTQNPYIFEIAQANVEIEGKWYFTATPPNEIQIAVLKLVGGVLKENVSDGDIKELKSEKLGDYAVTYQDVDKLANSLKINSILDQFKRSTKQGSSGVIVVS